MSTPDQQLVPVFPPKDLGGEFGFPQLNPFQLKLFCELHRSIDNFISLKSMRQRFYGPQDFDLEKIKEDIRRDIESNNGYTLAHGIPAALFGALVGNEECNTLTEISLRGLLGIDKKTYRAIYSYFETYSLRLRLNERGNEITPSDARLFSNRIDFRQFESELAGYRLKVIGYPDAETYSEEKFHRFIFGVKERVASVLKDISSGQSSK